MKRQKSRALLISDFNIEVFSSYLNNDEDFPLVDTIVAPLGQIIPVLVEKNLEYWKNNIEGDYFEKQK